MSDSHTGADDSDANGDGSVVSRRTALALLASAGTIGGGAIALRHFETGPGTTARRTTQETTGDATTTTERRESGRLTVRIGEATTEMGDVQEGFNRALHDAGLDESVTVDLRPGPPGGLKPRQTTYQQWLDTGQERPTILLVASGWTLPFVQRDQLADLGALASDSTFATVREDYVDPLVMTATGSDGSLYAQPLFLDVSTVQYRKDLFRQAGYGDSVFQQWATDPPTWQAFADAVRTVNTVTDAEYGFTFQASAYEGLSCCTFAEFMSSWGGAYFGNPAQYLFGPVGERPITVAEQPALDAIRMIRAFVHGPEASNALDDYPQIAPAAVLDWSEEPSRKPFTNGDAVAHRNWSYAVQINAADAAVGDHLGVMPLPYAVSESEARYPMTGGTVAALGGWHAAINPNASKQRQQAAIEVLVAMQRPSFQRWAFRTLDWLPPRRSLLDDPGLASQHPLGPYLDTLAVAAENAIPRPVTRVWPQESKAISAQVHAALADDISPSNAMSALTEQLRQIEQSV